MAEGEAFLLQQLHDFRDGLLADVLDLEEVVLGVVDEVLQGADVGILERVQRPDREAEVVDGPRQAVAQVAAGLGDGRRGLPHDRDLAELDEVPEVLLREGGGVGDGVLGRDGAVGLDGDREPVVVGALADAGFRDGEVGAA